MEEEFDWRLPPEMDKQAPTRRFANRRVVVPYERMPYVDRFTQWRDWHRDLLIARQASSSAWRLYAVIVAVDFKKHRPFRLTTRMAERAKIDIAHKSRPVRELEKLGIIAVEGPVSKNPLVTLLHKPQAGHPLAEWTVTNLQDSSPWMES
jgi:hypothetical protein